MTAEQQPASRSRGTILSLTKYIPYPEITHAGGQYLLAHAEALSGQFDIEFLAPNTPLNRAAVGRTEAGVKADLLGKTLRGFTFRFLQLESVWSGSSVYLPIRRLFQSDRAPCSQLDSADIIEFQWSEMISLAPSVRKRLPNAFLVGVAHDVITQRLERQAAREHSVIKRSLLNLAARHSRKREAASFAALNTLIVFSEKDAELAREISPKTHIQVVHPGVAPAQPAAQTKNSQDPVVLFVGAMNRPENDDAATWFIKEVWPGVLDKQPEAKFVVAGAKPSERLQKLTHETPGVQLTGFVTSFDEVYEQAAVCVVPLRYGAGVKFKTVEAMMRGLPVVTTSVGAEGIDAAHLIAAIPDDKADFAAAIISQLRNPNLALVQQAQHWANSVYSFEAFSEAITRLYGGFARG